MKFKAHGDTREFNRTVQALKRERKQDTYSFLTQWAGVLTRDCMRFLPPRAGKVKGEGADAGKEDMNWAAQKKAGEGAVARDIRRVFRGADQFKQTLDHDRIVSESPKLKQAIESAFDSGDLSKLNQLLKRIKSPLRVMADATRGMHFPQRRRGRVPKRPNMRFFVAGKGDARIKAYIRTILKDVGKLKAGFMKAATLLGVKKIPKWVTRHAGIPGDVVDDRRNSRHPSVTIINNAPHEGINGSEVIEPAIRINQHKMQVAWQKITAHRHRKHSSKSAR